MRINLRQIPCIFDCLNVSDIEGKGGAFTFSMLTNLIYITEYHIFLNKFFLQITSS